MVYNSQLRSLSGDCPATKSKYESNQPFLSSSASSITGQPFSQDPESNNSNASQLDPTYLSITHSPVGNNDTECLQWWTNGITPTRDTQSDAYPFLTDNVSEEILQSQFFASFLSPVVANEPGAMATDVFLTSINHSHHNHQFNQQYHNHYHSHQQQYDLMQRHSLSLESQQSQSQPDSNTVHMRQVMDCNMVEDAASPIFGFSELSLGDCPSLSTAVFPAITVSSSPAVVTLPSSSPSPCIPIFVAPAIVTPAVVTTTPNSSCNTAECPKAMRVSALPAQAPAITGSTTAKRRGRKSNKTPTIHKCIITGCSSEFDRKYTLQQHIFTHLPKSQRPFACTHEGCSKRFNRWADKMRHERVHTGESSFQCKFCETSFSRPDARLNHYRRVHRE